MLSSKLLQSRRSSPIAAYHARQASDRRAQLRPGGNILTLDRHPDDKMTLDFRGNSALEQSERVTWP
jgi:hypothetical protein